MSKKILFGQKENDMNKNKGETDEDEIPSEANRDGFTINIPKIFNINIPKVFDSYSNNVSKMHNSSFSSNNSQMENKANSENNKSIRSIRNNNNMIYSENFDLDKDIDYSIINNKHSNFFSEKGMIDEIINDDKNSVVNQNNLSNISEILINKNKIYLDFIIQNKIISRQKSNRNAEFDEYTSQDNFNTNKKNIASGPAKTNVQNKNALLNPELIKENNSAAQSHFNYNDNKGLVALKNSLYNKDTYDYTYLDKRLSKINHQVNNLKLSINPASIETEIGTKITDKTSLYKNSNLSNNSGTKSKKFACFKNLCSNGEKKNFSK